MHDKICPRCNKIPPSHIVVPNVSGRERLIDGKYEFVCYNCSLILNGVKRDDGAPCFSKFVSYRFVDEPKSE